MWTIHSKGHMRSLQGSLYPVKKLMVPYWMSEDYTGQLGTHEERRKIKKILRLR